MVEYLHPGVYVTEIPFAAKPIDGVPTSTAQGGLTHAALHSASLPSVPSPDWTQHNDGDPGVTFLQMLAWLGDLSLFRTVANVGWGVAHELAVEPQDANKSADVTVSRGLAIASDGQPCETESNRSSHRVRKP